MTPEVIALQILRLLAAAPTVTQLNPGEGAPSPEQTAKAWGMIALIALAGVIMLLLMVGLIVMRRMYRARRRRLREDHGENASAGVDAWSEAAKRMKVEPPPESPQPPENG